MGVGCDEPGEMAGAMEAGVEAAARVAAALAGEVAIRSLPPRLVISGRPAKQWGWVRWRPCGQQLVWRAAAAVPALLPPNEKEEQQEQEDAEGSSSHGLQPGTSDAEAQLCSAARDLAVRQMRPKFLRTNASPGFLQTTHRLLFATLRLLQLSCLVGMPRSRKAVVRASRTTSIQPVEARQKPLAFRRPRRRDLRLRVSKTGEGQDGT